MVASIFPQNDLYTPISKIAENTEPIHFANWDITWWSFSVAILSLIVGIIAAIYSYRGYKFQKLSTEKLDKLIPGQISYYEVICCLINNIFDIESIFFGSSSYTHYPTKLVLSLSKLPEDLINLDKYERNRICFEEALKLKIAWRNYNIVIDELIANIKTYSNSEVISYSNYLISLSKSYITLIQNFESILVQYSLLGGALTSNNRIAFFILDRFFEYLSTLDTFGIDSIDTKRSNLKKECEDSYIRAPYLPNLLDFDEYLNSSHSFRLKIFHKKTTPTLEREEISAIYNSIKSGKYDKYTNCIILPPSKKFSSLDPHRFKNAYFNYIEPIIIGYKRSEYDSLLNEG